ncbi:MAG: hypothetical protein HY051_05275 [Candidatus Aenigmarchaeota archaeon]|nr:hypothetical protein [Candidatus Aenigmarchaeota archaeon]
MKSDPILLLAAVLRVSGCVQNNYGSQGANVPDSGDGQNRSAADQTAQTTTTYVPGSVKNEKQSLYNSLKREVEALYQQNPE